MKSWLKLNLFRSYWDGLMTVVSAVIAIWLVVQIFTFVFITGRWEIVQVNIKLLLIGRFPEEHIGLLLASVMAISFWIGITGGAFVKPDAPKRKVFEIVRELFQRFGLIALLGIAVVYLAGTGEAVIAGVQIVVAIVAGRLLSALRTRNSILRAIPSLIWVVFWGLAPTSLIWYTLSVSTLETWGGFLINFYIAVLSIVLCFPLGVLLALGRRSSLPVIRILATTYIEIVRGAPLFVLLLLAGVALEFFIPPEITPDVIFRSVTVFTLFTAAYLAEIIRGGLQSIPKGQTEAGKAIGLSTVRIISLITLPQALRNVIPAQIGQFISLFKDTTLAGAALSMFEILSIGKAITKQDDFLGQGLIYESLAFVGLMFWVGSFVMSRESQRLEKKLGVGIR
jgi:general L-amino acid transport system permease protein